MGSLKEIMNDLRIEASLAAENETTAIRLFKSQRPVSLFIGWNPETEITTLYVLLEKKLDPLIIESFPIWKGVSIEQMQFSLPLHAHYNKWFLKFSHLNKNDINIFEAILENICEELIELDSYGEMITALQLILEQWKAFFMVHGKEGLSPQAQQGLYGEIWLLRELLRRNPSAPVIKGWIGPEKRPHDFQINSDVIEVKSIASKKPYKIYVSNELQFESLKPNNLLLVVVILIKNNNGENLAYIVDSVRKLLENEPYKLSLFNSKLFLAGYIDHHRSKYNIGFNFFNGRSYEVVEDFPRINTNNLNEGIGDVKYTLSLAACEKYKTNFKELLNRLACVEVRHK